MSKKFEYVDDNPGAYFGMLVESVEDKKDIKQRKVNESSDLKNFKVFYIRKSDDKSCTETIKAKNEDDARKLFKKSNKDIYRIHKVIEESLTEDKFVPQDKMSKKAQKELNDKKRGTWCNTNPVTRVQPNKKAYDRKRDSKVDLDEAKETVSSLSELADKIDKLSAVSMAYEDDGKIKIKGRWRKSTRQSHNDYVDINSSLKKLLGDKKYNLVFEDIDSRDGGKEFSARFSLTVPAERDKKVVDEDIENKDSEEYLGVDEVKRFVNAREKLLDISDSMTTDLRLGRISREDILYYRNEIKEIYSFLNSLYFGR